MTPNSAWILAWISAWILAWISAWIFRNNGQNVPVNIGVEIPAWIFYCTNPVVKYSRRNFHANIHGHVLGVISDTLGVVDFSVRASWISLFGRRGFLRSGVISGLRSGIISGPLLGVISCSPLGCRFRESCWYWHACRGMCPSSSKTSKIHSASRSN